MDDVINPEEFDKLDDEDDAKGDGGGGRAPRAGRRGSGSNRFAGRSGSAEGEIEDLLREGQEIIVQVVKEPLGTKGARLRPTSRCRAASRLHADRGPHRCRARSNRAKSEAGCAASYAVPRRNRVQRRRHHPDAASGRPKDDILSDLVAFHKIWKEIRQRTESSRAPAVLYQEQSIVSRLLRDLLTEDYQAIRIDNATEHQRVLELVERIMPSPRPR